jgi:two-component system, chemotaxis family, chemotaxis protein CheY
MVIDDHPQVRAGVAALLGQLGQVSTAANGELALAQLKSQPMHVLVVDLHMPVMGGTEFIRCYRQQAGEGAIVLMSADPALCQIADEVGADAWFSKGSDPDLIYCSVAALLERQLAVRMGGR